MTLYRAPRKPIVVGELRMRSWNASTSPPASDLDPVWVKRAKDYWMLQERLYGLRMSGFTLLVGEEDGLLGMFPVVSTYAVVEEILPGERTTDHSRVTAEAAMARE